MKIEQVLVQQLYHNKYITLQGIGTFRLDGNVSLPADSEKGIVLPENAIYFEYNPKATEDDSLIDAIVLHTKKIKPLASADLDSFLMLGRQFLNIGKPFRLEGLGTLDKTQEGDLEFKPGQFITPKIEAPKALKENENEEKSGLFPDYDTEVNRGSRKMIFIIISILILGAGAWAGYYFLYKNKNENHVSGISQNKTTNDSINKDSSGATALNTTTQSKTSNDGYTFKVVFKETNDREEALKIMNKFKDYGHNTIMYTTDSVLYKVAEPFTLPLSDTTHIKDSLNHNFYAGKAHIEIR